MIWRQATGSALALLALSWAGAGALAAELHRPLPPDSLERNGTPQVLKDHLHLRRPPPALPGGGLHPNAAAGLARAYSGTPIDVLTYHYDRWRTGWNAHETDLTPATVGSAAFGQITTINVDGNVLAEPLLVSQFHMPDASVHDVLVIVTGRNSVYALDAQTYQTLWTVNLGPSQSSSDVGCGDVVPEYGISSTPIIVRTSPSAATIYLVAATEPASMSFHTKLHALSLGNGADLITPVEIAPSAPLPGGGTISFDPQDQWSRAGLGYVDGSIYVGIGSHCDNNAGAISGWLLRYNTRLQLLHAFNTIQASAGYELSSVWMTGFAPAIGAHDEVFVVTGNGNFSQTAGAIGWGESVLGLSSDLTRVLSSFTPSRYAQLNDGDTDFGSGGVMLLPAIGGQTAPPMAVAMGKDAVLYLLNQNNLGGLKTNDAGALQWQRLGSSGSGLWGGPAYYAGGAGPRVFAQIDSDILRGYRIAIGATPALTQASAGTSSAGYGGSLPIVSSNGEKAGTGVVWLIRRGASEQLEAYNAEKLGAPIFAANAGSWSNTNSGNSFVTPLEANGRVYVPAYKTVTVFGLTQ